MHALCIKSVPICVSRQFAHSAFNPMKPMKTLNTLKNRAMLSATTHPTESRVSTAVTMQTPRSLAMEVTGHWDSMCYTLDHKSAPTCYLWQSGQRKYKCLFGQACRRDSRSPSASVVHSVLPEHMKINMRLNPRIEPAAFYALAIFHLRGTTAVGYLVSSPCSVHLHEQDLEF